MTYMMLKRLITCIVCLLLVSSQAFALSIGGYKIYDSSLDGNPSILIAKIGDTLLISNPFLEQQDHPTDFPIGTVPHYKDNPVGIRALPDGKLRCRTGFTEGASDKVQFCAKLWKAAGNNWKLEWHSGQGANETLYLKLEGSKCSVRSAAGAKVCHYSRG